METTSHKITTKLDRAGTAQPTVLTITWDLPESDLRAIAAKALIIIQQSRWRDAGSVPATATVAASDLAAKRGRARAPRAPMTADRAVAELPVAELLAALKAAGALTPEVLKSLRSGK